jgi:hypothetical protein
LQAVAACQRQQASGSARAAGVASHAAAARRNSPVAGCGQCTRRAHGLDAAIHGGADQADDQDADEHHVEHEQLPAQTIR